MKTPVDPPAMSPSTAPDRRRAGAAWLPLYRFGARLALPALLLAAAAAQAQNVDDGYAPTLPVNSNVYAVVVQADGKALVGGNFSEINGQPCPRICRLLADGSLDPAFAKPDVAGYVNTIATQADGKILIGGSFTTVDGVPRQRIARLNASGSLDAAFVGASLGGGDPDPVAKLVVQADGKILIGGRFDSVGGQPRRGVARLDANGHLDTGFADPGVSNESIGIHQMALQADGKLLIGGEFARVGGQLRNGFARLNADGRLDTGFTPSVSGTPLALLPRQDGKIMVGGAFSVVDGQLRQGLVRLNQDGSLDVTFADPDLDAQVMALAWQPDGKLLVAGAFSHLGGQPTGSVVRLDADGSVDTRFRSGAAQTGGVWQLALQADGKLLAGGSFTTIGSQPRSHLARLNVDGSLDVSLDERGDDVAGGVSAVALQADGKVLASEYFTYVDYPNHHITRLNHDGKADPGFAEVIADDRVNTLVVQTDGKVLVSGRFTHIAGQARGKLARLNADGSLDSTFLPFDSSGSIFKAGLQSDGKILIYGGFYQVGGRPQTFMARLNPDGSLDPSFANPDIDPLLGMAYPFDFAIQADGKIVIAGPFRSVGGVPRAALARLNADGSLDTSHIDRSPPNVLYAYDNLTLQPDGKLLLYSAHAGLIRLNIDGSPDTGFTGPGLQTYPQGGRFALQSDGRIVIVAATQYQDLVKRLNADGTPDSGFASIITDNNVFALLQQTDGKLLLAGDFNTLAGGTGDAWTRSHLARVSLPGAALQALVLDGSTVTWRRGGVGPASGSAPMLSYSSDGATFTPLGPMTRIDGGWQRSGVPALDGFSYLRAEARSGSVSGNGQIHSVRQVFRPADAVFSNGFE